MKNQSFEMLVSRRARLHYGLSDTLFALDGNVILADLRAARQTASAINAVRRASGDADRSVSASDINAAGLLHEVMHHLIGIYRQKVDPDVFARALKELEIDLGVTAVETTLEAFVEAFPPRAVRDDEISPLDYLESDTGGVANRQVVVEEIVLLWLANNNPALEPLRDLFDDAELVRTTAYSAVVNRLQAFFKGRPGLESGGPTLIDLLHEPVAASPHSLQQQLDFIRNRWGLWVENLMVRLLGGLDFLAEEHRPVFPPGPGPIVAPTYEDWHDEEFEAFSADLEWMPRVVLIAKNTYVWLTQLSREFDREITRLDQIPDEALDRLQIQGITGLWLIGLWERSRASETIKRWMGDEDAVASAYSLHDYVVAADLGGQEAFDDLKTRAWERGVRMTTDMVPNHVGIDGRWVIEHPDWFIGLPDCPYPDYSFTGADLCADERVGIYLEDGYWDKSDAAVVFKRVDHWTGEVRYIYHGNDGTSMPWNDTAQLDYRKPEVREAVIQTILHVAQLSPIIRFDAAMTLTRKNFQRLWFPEPGTGGDIPSRSGFGINRSDFEQLMPEEFWREVVDRSAAEASDTLLLAEAFWMLEGYFVRTLGMHRVYNSAFMNMLRDEANDEYRKLIRNTLEYDPRILSRYVNFMSNPDEETAEEQFGRGDKYFGICTMMATLPGLPMFGHGQIEGYREKYGMEFRTPRWDEQPDEGLRQRHENQIFPLLRRRRLFSGVESFRLYDLVTGDGTVDENVFAYSNQFEGQRSLVVFHNRFGDTAGWVDHAAPALEPWHQGEHGTAYHRLGQDLGLTDSDDTFVVFRDLISGLEFIRPSRQILEHGLFVQLNAYQLHVFWQFREVVDEDGISWWPLVNDLQGRGVHDVDVARRRLECAPVLGPWQDLLEELAQASGPSEALENALLTFVVAARRFCGAEGPAASAVIEALPRVESALSMVVDDEGDDTGQWRSLVSAAWAAVGVLNGLAGEAGATAADRWTDWSMGLSLAEVILERGGEEQQAEDCGSIVALLLALEQLWPAAFAEDLGFDQIFEDLVADETVARFLGVNRWQDTLWIRSEGLEAALPWFELVVGQIVVPGVEAEARRFLAELRGAAIDSGYRVDRLLEALRRVSREGGV
ncbi:MAG: alpha-amylase [Acidobacteria bacterium]|nr:MAG: alpha-amylase [Acidobacteriota bacterium]